ncbi:MAG: hypothetical protein WBG01_06965 [Bacteroidota bacterium]
MKSFGMLVLYGFILWLVPFVVAVGIAGQFRWEKLEGNVAVQFEVQGFVDEPHTATPDMVENLVV